MKKIALLATGFLCLLLLMKCNPDRGSKDKTVDYTLVSDLVMQALLRQNNDIQEDTSRVVKVNFRGAERIVGAARPEDLDRIVYINDEVRDQTNAIISLTGDGGTCCCPCNVQDEDEVTLYSNHCPCPKFYQLDFLAPDTVQAEMYFDQEKFKAEEWEAAEGWVLFSVPEKTVTEGDHAIRISGAFFGTATREEFVINITIIDGKAYVR